ncbi:unnamed protein product [Kuraishia capsulata CBS 1993]|uniref:Uncharacterized protein n=1 Tax=Kuraishia capsulata CBS 1993 TaxID=1382522 RepID=W6MRW5_9ASCO|nr:uncharacterized protein KUCA_T00000531001 [Kuraishia capsulata CBS 1993]CDK24565.1 unnamed protein product [Kuraishia capsulata CBS 1993]
MENRRRRSSSTRANEVHFTHTRQGSNASASSVFEEDDSHNTTSETYDASTDDDVQSVSTQTKEHSSNLGRLLDNHSRTSLLLYKNKNNSSSTLQPLTNTLSNVEFNNIRSSMDNGERERARSPTLSSPATAFSRLGRDNALARLLTNQGKGKTKKRTSIDDLKERTSFDNARDAIIKSSESISAKLKKPVGKDLMISSSGRLTEAKSPLARTSKEVERIANIGQAEPQKTQGLGLSAGSSLSLPGKQKHHKSYHKLLSRAKGSTTKSSSNSNSQLSSDSGGKALYSFHPNTNGMSVGDLQKTVTELEKQHLSDDRETIADDAWALLCSIVTPLFKCDQLKTPIEEVTKLVYLHLRLRLQESGSPVPTGSPLGTFSSPVSQFGSADPISRNVLDEYEELFTVGMTTYVNQLYIEESTNNLRLKRYYTDSPSGPRSTKRGGERSRRGSFSASTGTASYSFAKKVAVLWEYFLNDILFYLEGIFLPLQLELNSHPPSPTSNSEVVDESELSVRNLILTAFRDHVVIPLYESEREQDKERRREKDSSSAMVNTSAASGIVFGTSSSSEVNRRRDNTNGSSRTGATGISDDSEEDYSQVLTLLQCFTILASVQTNDTNQKIMENLTRGIKQQSKMFN